MPRLAKFIKRRFLVLLLLALFLPPLFYFLFLTAVDLRNPTESRRFTLLWKLGLVRETNFTSKLFATPELEQMWQETDLYWYPKDQQTLSGESGYYCNIIGTLVEKGEGSWKVRVKNGQIFTLNLGGTHLSESAYNYLVPQYDEEGKFSDLKTEPASGVKDAIQEGRLILVKWACPEKDLLTMVEEKGGLVKENYLYFTPLSILTLREE